MNARLIAKAIWELNPKSDRTEMKELILFKETNIYQRMMNSILPKWVKKATKFAEYNVIATHNNGLVSWNGKQVNVHDWYELEDNVSIGWNLNASAGHSFPHIKC